MELELHLMHPAEADAINLVLVRIQSQRSLEQIDLLLQTDWGLKNHH